MVMTITTTMGSLRERCVLAGPCKTWDWLKQGYSDVGLDQALSSLMNYQVMPSNFGRTPRHFKDMWMVMFLSF